MPGNAHPLKPHSAVLNAAGDPIYRALTQLAPLTDDFAFDRGGSLVVIHPRNVLWEAPVVPRSAKTLEEHILYIQENQIKRAMVIAEDISFLRQCPSLERLIVIPPYSAAEFDYSPLYDMPGFQYLSCQTVYGYKDRLTAHIDYSRLVGVYELDVRGAKGHHNTASLRGVKVLHISQGQPESKLLADAFDVTALEDVDITQSPIRSLDGLEDAKHLRRLALWHNRQLEDISALSFLSESLATLDIEACGKIKDFSVLHKLHNLKHLRLYGSNALSNLSFLKEMPKLKTFTFTMNVLDGDLSLCMNIPYASCCNKKHYNLRDSDLPKVLDK